MLRKLYCIGLLSLVSSSLGCAMCCSPDDYSYGAYGGRWQRQDWSIGRVGSAFSSAGYDSVGEVLHAEPAAQPEVVPEDERIRSVSYEEVSSYIE